MVQKFSYGGTTTFNNFLINLRTATTSCLLTWKWDNFNEQYTSSNPDIPVSVKKWVHKNDNEETITTYLFFVQKGRVTLYNEFNTSSPNSSLYSSFENLYSAITNTNVSITDDIEKMEKVLSNLS